MRVSWITTDMHMPFIVEYGTDSGTCAETATGEQTLHRYFSYVSGKIHHGKIGPLMPNTVYYSRCGGDGDEFSFKTPPSVLPIEFELLSNFQSQVN
jgi:acid phosphatase type 7